jgi:hypothetical protein
MKKQKVNNVVSRVRALKLKSLPAGTPFVFVSCQDLYKELYLIHPSDSRCVIKGIKADIVPSGDKEWSAFVDSCAPDAEVLLDEGRQKISITVNSKGEFVNNGKVISQKPGQSYKKKTKDEDGVVEIEKEDF